MIKPEISEIKKQFNKDSNVINRLCGCYVDAEKNIKLMSGETFFRIDEEDAFKYEDIFRKTLSGSLGKGILNIDIPLESEREGGAQEFMLRLRESRLEDESLLAEFYTKVIESYEYPENYYIILADIVYDIPGKASDGTGMDDASDESYHAIICSICPVKLSKAGLSYNAETMSISNRVRDWVVDAPVNGFLFPAFNDRSTDIHSFLYFAKKYSDLKPEFVYEIFGADCPMPAKEQKESIQNMLINALGESCDYELVSNVHDRLNDLIAEHADEPEPLVIDKKTMLKVISDSGADDEAVLRYEKLEDSDIEVLAKNIVDRGSLEVRTPGIVIKADAEHIQLMSTKVVDGRKCLVIVIDESIEVNGMPVRSMK